MTRGNTTSSPKKKNQRQTSTSPRKTRKGLWITLQQDSALVELELTTGLSQSEHLRRALDLYFEHIGGRETK